MALQLARKLELASGRDAPALAARLADVLRELRVLEAPDHVDALRARAVAKLYANGRSLDVAN